LVTCSPQFLFNDEAVLNELDLLPEVINGIPGVSIQVSVLAQPSYFLRLIHVILKVPWPFANRDLVILIHVFDCFDLISKDILISAKSVEGDEVLGIKVPPPPPGVSRMSESHHLTCLKLIIAVRKSAGSIRSLNDTLDLLNITMTMNVDLHIGFVPPSLINFAAKTLLYYGYKLFIRKAKDLAETKHAQRITDNPDFYQYVRNRMLGETPAVPRVNVKIAEATQPEPDVSEAKE